MLLYIYILDINSMPLMVQRKRERQKAENVGGKKNRYVIIDDRKIFLSIDRALSVIEIYIEDTSTSLILVKVIDNNYISILIKSFN